MVTTGAPLTTECCSVKPPVRVRPPTPTETPVPVRRTVLAGMLPCSAPVVLTSAVKAAPNVTPGTASATVPVKLP
jgi:hypothetical protein